LDTNPSLRRKYVDAIAHNDYKFRRLSPREMKTILDVMANDPKYTDVPEHAEALTRIKDELKNMTGIDFSQASPKVLSGVVEQFIKPEPRTYKGIEITESNAPALADKIMTQSEGKIPDFETVAETLLDKKVAEKTYDSIINSPYV